MLPIEVKSGKDYTVHSALDNFLKTSDYHVNRAIVLNNSGEVRQTNGITYMPVYYSMFIERRNHNEADYVIPIINEP